MAEDGIGKDGGGSDGDGGSGLDVLVVGSANADLMVEVTRRPRAGETVLGSDLVVRPGGKGANQAVAAARLGARTALLARVGDDPYGKMLLSALARAGVATAGVAPADAPTGVALITVDPSGDNSIVVAPGANSRLTPAAVAGARQLLSAARVVTAQLEIPPESVAEVVRHLRPGTRFLLNASPPCPLPAAVLAACDPLVVNQHEAQVLLGTGGAGAGGTEPGRTEPGGGPESWVRGLLGLGARSVVVTLGAAGAVVGGRGAGTEHVPAVAVTAVDTTGAGDAFAAALAWRLSRGDGLRDAAVVAVRAGAEAVARRGAQEQAPADGAATAGDGRP